jgi:hypothetical protein
MLGSRCRDGFEEWFATANPTHACIVACALSPTGAMTAAPAGRCPLCRFPVASHEVRPRRMSAEAEAEIRERHRSWRPEDGVCTQCLDLYEARCSETTAGRR